MKLKEKVAIVTGAAQGIGRSIALELASAGAHVLVSDIQDQKVSEVAKEITNMGQKSLHMSIDVTIAEQVIEIKAIARDAGSRTKIAVKTNDNRIKFVKGKFQDSLDSFLDTFEI